MRSLQCTGAMWPGRPCGRPAMARRPSAARRLEHDAAFAHHHDAVGQLQELVQVLADQQHAAPPARARRAAGRGSRPPAAKSRPKQGLATISSVDVAASSRASTARCTLPPDRVCDRRVRPGRLDADRRRSSSRACCAHRAARQPPARAPAARGRSRAAPGSRPRSARRRRRCAAAPRAGCAPCSGGICSRVGVVGLAVDADLRRRRAARWPVSASTSSRWPLPETPATPTISPGVHASGSGRARPARRGRRCTVQAACTSQRGDAALGHAAARCGVRRRAVAAARWPRPLRPSSSRPAASRRGVGHRAAPVHRRPRRSTVTSSAEADHLAELVRDDQHRAARRARAQRAHLAQHLVGLLRRQHRGRLVQDQEARVAGTAASGSRASASRPPPAPATRRVERQRGTASCARNSASRRARPSSRSRAGRSPPRQQPGSRPPSCPAPA